MKILITGGAGFIGSHLAESWLKDGHSVSVIDDLSTGSLDTFLREGGTEGLAGGRDEGPFVSWR